MKYLLLPLFLFSTILSLSASDFRPAASTIQGIAYDRDSGDRLGFVYLHIEELNRTVVAHEDGDFEFTNIPAGTYTLSATRIGYKPLSQQVKVPQSDTVTIEIRLQPTVLSGNTVEVVGNQERGTGSQLEHASKNISGTALRRNLSSTLAKTLEDIPGFDSRSMGAAPARPIIRGLGGERVLILQDGARTGDVSSQSADHAVTVDPVAAEEIEIARGPAALKYGGNAIGGIVNIVRNQISTSMPDHFHGTSSLQGESVNNGGTAAIQAGLPVGSFALKLDGNIRTGQNINTPRGQLANSGILSSNNAVGLSYIQPWGYVGGAASMYLNNYGIPPDPNGGHPNGVDIEMQKFQFDSKSEIFFEESFFKAIEAKFSYKNYYHREVESSGIIGTEFGVLTSNASISTRHGSLGILDKGYIGIWAEAKDYAIQGTNTPDSDSYSLAGYLVEEKDLGSLHLELGGRFDFINTVPSTSNPNSNIGNIRERNFKGASASISAIYDFGSGIFVGTTLMRSFRSPSQEELYSEGPHLASYSYEIGNPDLGPETGFGKELFVRLRNTTLNAEVAGYHNSFNNYIYPRDTGDPSLRFPSLNVYQFTGTDAQLYGIEASAEFLITSQIALTGNIHYTYAQREVTNEEKQVSGQQSDFQPLPMIPPLKSSLNLKYARQKFEAGAKVRIAAEQNRTGDFESPTDGYTVFDLYGQYRFESSRMLHTIALNISNLLNTEYYNHLSRIKDIRPEPGRNISILYRLYF